MNYPFKYAYHLANKMKLFRALTEEFAHSEINSHAEEDRIELVKRIDWEKFNDVLEQLQKPYLLNKKKPKTL